MHLGAVLPHHEIGTDPGALVAYAQGLEALGVANLLVYDHVLGADRDRPGGFEGVYDKEVAFHEPLTFLSFVAAVTTTIELVTAVLILPQRQAVLVAKQAAEVAVLSGNRLRLGVGVGWNMVEYVGLNERFGDRGRRQAEQVELMRRLWTEDSFSFAGEFHTIEHAGINPRPTEPIPIWFGGSAPAVLERCAVLGDGWVPLGTPNDTARERLETIRNRRETAGLSMDRFAIQAQAQYAGGDPDRWRTHASRWRALGATHLSIATHNAGPTDVDGHLRRVAEYLDAVRENSAVPRRMTDDEVRQFLSTGTRTGKLAWAGSNGQPHVAPIWFVLDADADDLEVVFNTGAESAKGRAIRRDPRVSLLVDDERPPFAFVKLTGSVTVSEDPAELLRWATAIGGRYMGADRAEEFGRRNGVPGELLVRLRPAKVIAEADVAGRLSR